MTPLGTCRLCLRVDVPLQKSHLLPAGFYRVIRGADKNPIQIGRERSHTTSRQAQARLLCRSCEQRFANRGENWVLRHCWRSPTQFGLRDRLKAVVPEASREHLFVYRLSDSLADAHAATVYFAASLFWRAAVHRWDRQAVANVVLGKYAEEQLRMYLLDERPFPEDMVLVLMMTATSDEIANQLMSMPHLAGRRPYHSFRADIPGMSFVLMVGSRIPDSLRRVCTARTGLVTVCPQTDEWRLRTALKMVEQVTATTKHRKRI